MSIRPKSMRQLRTQEKASNVSFLSKSIFIMHALSFSGDRPSRMEHPCPYGVEKQGKAIGPLPELFTWYKICYAG